MKYFFLIIILAGYFSDAHCQNINSKPEYALPFCDTAGILFAGGTNVPDAFPVKTGCLDESPNPAWFYMRVDVTGSMKFTISSNPDRDIDFIAWGPFQTLNLTNMSQYNIQNQVDCSYDPSSVEVIDFPNAQKGEYYIVLITNYSNDPNTINFKQTGGTGSTDCDLLIASSSSPVCEGQKIRLSTGLDSTKTSFLWTGPNGFTSIKPNPEILNASSLNQGKYTLLAKQSGKEITSGVWVFVNPIQSPLVTGDTLVCSGKTSLLTANGGPYQTYLWKNKSGLVVSAKDSVSVPPGIYTVTVSSENGCSRVSDEIQVSQREPVLPVIKPGLPLHICGNDTLSLYTTKNYASYEWSNGAKTQKIIISAPGYYKVQVTDEFGCRGGSAGHQITGSNPKADILGKAGFCSKDSILLTSNPGYPTYRWVKGNDTLGSSQNYMYRGEKITLLIKDTFGCKDSSSFSSTPYPEPIPLIDGIKTFCGNESIILTGNSGNVQYRWIKGKDTLGYSQKFVSGGGEITLLVRNQFGCSDAKTISLNPLPRPKADFTLEPADAKVNSPIMFNNNSIAGQGDIISGYFWIFNPPGANSSQKNPTYTFSEAGEKNITLIISGANGCKDTIAKTLLVSDYDEEKGKDPIEVFNVITPNGDEFNQYFEIKNIENFPGNIITILDRWGDVVFQKENYKNNWDGENLPGGTYFYILSLPDFPVMKGSLTIIRN